jgi:hypothetical protein
VARRGLDALGLWAASSRCVVPPRVSAAWGCGRAMSAGLGASGCTRPAPRARPTYRVCSNTSRSGRLAVQKSRRRPLWPRGVYTWGCEGRFRDAWFRHASARPAAVARPCLALSGASGCTRLAPRARLTHGVCSNSSPFGRLAVQKSRPPPFWPRGVYTWGSEGRFWDAWFRHASARPGTMARPWLDLSGASGCTRLAPRTRLTHKLCSNTSPFGRLHVHASRPAAVPAANPEQGRAARDRCVASRPYLWKSADRRNRIRHRTVERACQLTPHA